MDQQRFQDELAHIGYTFDDMQQLLGISRTAFYRKRKGITQFTVEEIRKMRKVLSADACDAIFFAAKVS